jgi:23S rRNA (uracil1939-C5)-methyltransferase
VHRGESARIHARIADALGDPRERNVLELFAGAGALGLRLAAAGARVTLVESFAAALEAALEAARAQGVGGIGAEHGDASEVAAKLVASGARFDAIVVNPPRRGLPPGLRSSLAELAPPLLAYVSCEPTTLARDLAHLRRLGLATDCAEPFDMIPLSAEVECLALLRTAPPPPPRVIYRDEDVIVVDKDPHEPTTPQGEHRGSLLARVRRLPGAEGALPVHRLDLGTSGVCVFARDSASAAAWSAVLSAADATKEYVALVRGITRDKGSVARPLVESGRTLAARTRYRRERVVGGHSLLRVQPDEGRTHQIRRHLAAIGHPILGDARHGHAPSNRYLFERRALDRPFLHCGRIALVHPRTGARLALDSDLPGDLASVLDSLAHARGPVARARGSTP